MKKNNDNNNSKSNIKQAKSLLRAELLKRRSELSEDYIKQSSFVMFEKIRSLECYEKAKCIMIYVSYQNEIYTHDFINEMINEGKKVLTPICNKDHSMTLAVTTQFPKGFKPTKMGILEIPSEDAIGAEESEIDIIITPGLAFSPNGDRLGYGGGYYDRLFEKTRKDCLKICPCFDNFIIEDIPTGFFDTPVDMIISEKRSIFISKKAQKFKSASK